jgi:molybdopterin-guanine dinucleotide biosynthesis protein A
LIKRDPSADRATLGVVLAGGLARRLGGGDKAGIVVGGATMLERVLARLAPQCRGLILNANGDPARFAATGLAVVADGVPDYPGPLAGILAGLDWAASDAPDLAWVVTVPSDCPFLPRDLVGRLHQARIEAGTPVACAQSGGRRHPVVALWPVELRKKLRHALVHDNVRKVEEWAARCGVGVADWPDAPVDPFFNVNTPDDVATANRMAAKFPDL